MSKRPFSQSTCVNSQPDEAPQVDAAIKNASQYSIVNGKSVYLQMSNCERDNNKQAKYYIIQLLQQGGSHYLYTRYGRVGEAGKQNFAAHNLQTGLKTFDKTLNAKSRKGYKQIEMQLGSDSKDITPVFKKDTKTNETYEFEESKLEPSVKKLIEFITDDKAMQKTLVE